MAFLADHRLEITPWPSRSLDTFSCSLSIRCDSVLRPGMQIRLKSVPYTIALSVLMRTALAQSSDAASQVAGCAMCSTFLAIPIIIFVLNIALLVWVARDAKARGMDSAVLWMILVMFTSVIGLLIYIFSRPQGNLIRCPNCGNNRLQASVKCPHCGSAQRRSRSRT